MRRLLAVLLLTIAACGVESASGAVRPPSRLTLTPAAACASDSLCYVLQWPAVSDANGAADHYHVRITTSAGYAHEDTVTALSERVAIPTPAIGASVTVTASVWSIRRGLQSASAATATATARTADVAPPAPGSITITPDTLAFSGLPIVHDRGLAVAFVTSDSTATIVGGDVTMDFCVPKRAGITRVPWDTTWVITLAGTE